MGDIRTEKCSLVARRAEVLAETEAKPRRDRRSRRGNMAKPSVLRVLYACDAAKPFCQLAWHCARESRAW